MLTIPLDGPSMLHRNVAVLTTSGLIRGLILDETDQQVWLLVGADQPSGGTEQVIDRSDIRAIAAV